VLRKALESRLPVILVVNKIDRPDARIDEVVDEVYELFLDLDATRSRSTSRSSIRMPGRASVADANVPGEDLEPLFDLLISRIPPPSYDERHPLQAHVTNLDASPYVGRVCHLPRAPGHDPQGQPDRLVPRRRLDPACERDRAVRDRGARPRGRRRVRGPARSSRSPACPR